MSKYWNERISGREVLLTLRDWLYDGVPILAFIVVIVLVLRGAR